jgi:DNA repair protein RadD
MSDLFNIETSATFPPPRQFQETAHSALRDGLKAGHKNQLIMAPTGAGKTYLGLRIAHEALQRGKRALFVCDRITLINQTSEAADRYGLSDHGVIQSSHWRYDLRRPFQIASAQTLAHREHWPAADVIIIDEAHTQMRVWTDYIQRCRAAVVGLSATPFSPGLGKLFSNLINATTMHELTEAGVLVPMRVLSCTRVDMAGAATSGGEWTDKAAEERGMDIVGDVVTEWLRHASDRKTILFGSTIAHCEELCRQFVELGVMAAAFTSRTSAAERDSLLREYRKPGSALRVLISVEALAKGFDVPDVTCISDCRPMRKSLSTVIQMLGRGLRASLETGKTDCLLLDHSGNIVRFLDDFTDIYFNGLDTLDAAQKLDKTARKESEQKAHQECPACGYTPFAQRCMSCGHERKVSSLIEALPGEMREFHIGKRKLADDSRHLWEQLVSYTRSRDKKPGYAAHLFKDLVGTFPPSEWAFDETPEVPVTRNVMNQIRHRNIAWAKRKVA